MKIKNTLLCGVILFMAAFCFGKTDSIKASAVVEANGIDDSYAIQQELDSLGVVTLKKGGAYRLEKSIVLRSNMTINAEGATIICERPIAYNIPDETDYNSLSNVTIIGGTGKSEGSG